MFDIRPNPLAVNTGLHLIVLPGYGPVLPGVRGADDQMPVGGQLVGAGQVFAYKKIPRYGTLHVVRHEVSCFIDVIASEGSFVPTRTYYSGPGLSFSISYRSDN